jgi:mono/diheme cytochrome c family protein
MFAARCYRCNREMILALLARWKRLLNQQRRQNGEGAGMRSVALISVFLFWLFPIALSAQESITQAPELNKTQILGRRIYQQRCGICHTQPTASPMYGIALNKELVDGNEDMIRDYIRNGSMKMPGFKYGLEPAEIDAIVQYLKTVPKAAPRNPQQPRGEGPVD